MRTSNFRRANARRTALRRTTIAALALGTAASGVLAGQASASVAPRREKSAPTNTREACQTGSWSPVARGRPASLAPGSAAGVYLWHDENGWHLRVTHPGTDRVTFTGTVDSSAALAGIERATESNDDVQFTHVKGKVRFTFRNYGRIDGIDFVVGCSNSFTLNASINGRPIDNSKVFLGANSVRPTSVPFRMERS